ncbi:MAG TPA: AMP-binding protein [Acidimicrobiales bacterium]|nr:AMP-binding protein [Acidimicrobiales bacterium]
MGDFNFADAWETIAGAIPDRAAQRHDGRTQTWAEFDRRAAALAADLQDAGLGHQAKVAAYLYNGPEYLESYYAAWKVAAVPVNTNYRYGPEEVAYLMGNADAEAVVFDTSFTSVVEAVRDRLPLVKRWYAVGPDVPGWAVAYEEVVGSGATPAPVERSGDDLLLLYTGGTTGMPKGVMWRQDDLWGVLGGGGSPFVGTGPVEGYDELRQRVAASDEAAQVRMFPACPLMHGTGQFSAFIALSLGGMVVTDSGLARHFDPERLWQLAADERIVQLTIVGDAFARPMLAALDANPGRWELGSLMLINSSGVMWSQEVKDGLAKHLPTTFFFDSLGSSEAVGLGASVAGAGAKAATASFQLGAGARVVGPDDRDVTPGSGEQGLIALPGHIPLGYYKDEAKTAATFRTIDGTRYTLPGDWATVDADGGIHLLGRGSVVINTGGEKVFPEEVEEAVKRFGGVADAVAVGVPDERFGEVICALVEPETPGATIDRDALVEHVRSSLARYKAPRLVFTVDSINRSPSGKVDYKALKALAVERAATDA